MRKRIDDALTDVRHELEFIKTVVMIREPATVQAAEAYDGLRKAVIAGAAERSAHLQQLARLDAEISRGADIGAIQQLLRDLLAEAGLHRLDDIPPGNEACFDDVGGKGTARRVIEPAYVESTGRAEPRLIRSGKAEWVETTDVEPNRGVPASPEADPSAARDAALVGISPTRENDSEY